MSSTVQITSHTLHTFWKDKMMPVLLYLTLHFGNHVLFHFKEQKSELLQKKKKKSNADPKILHS